MGRKKKPDEPNPYNWQSDHPKHFVRREGLLQEALRTIQDGEGVFLLLGARGMGKSAFLAHLDEKLRANAELEVISFAGPPLPSGPTMVAGDIVRALRDMLVDCARRRGKLDGGSLEKALEKQATKLRLREMLEVYLETVSNEVERIVLVYDELDAYARAPSVGSSYFNTLEDVRKKLDQRLAVVAAGGLGLLSLKTVLGSSIFTRVAGRKILEPFRDDELLDLAQPFRTRGNALSVDVLATLRVLSGGNLALATYGLQRLWRVESPSPRDLARAFDEFRDNNNDFGASIRSAIFGFDDSEVPVDVWRSLKYAGGRIPRTDLDAIRRRASAKGAIESKDILDMLRASGFIRMDDQAWKGDPIVAEIVPSILSFDSSVDRQLLGSLVEQLRADLLEAMADIHRMTPAFYRPGRKDEDKHILPEAAFAAGLALSLDGRGWKTDLEPTSGAGYADIKARYPARFGEEHAIIEVKIWRGDVATIHDQVTSYFAKGVTALATVVVADHKDTDWKDEYERKCLLGKVDGSPAWRKLEPPMEGYFEASWGETRVVEHFLLRLPSRS